MRRGVWVPLSGEIGMLHYEKVWRLLVKSQFWLQGGGRGEKEFLSKGAFLYESLLRRIRGTIVISRPWIHTQSCQQLRSWRGIKLLKLHHLCAIICFLRVLRKQLLLPMKKGPLLYIRRGEMMILIEKSSRLNSENSWNNDQESSTTVFKYVHVNTRNEAKAPHNKQSTACAKNTRKRESKYLPWRYMNLYFCTTKNVPCSCPKWLIAIICYWSSWFWNTWRCFYLKSSYFSPHMHIPLKP